MINLLTFITTKHFLERKQNTNIGLTNVLLINETKTFMPVTILIIAIDHMARDDICNQVPSVFIVYFFHPHQVSLQVLGSIPEGISHTIIHEGCGTLIIPSGLSCCSFPLTSVTGPATMKDAIRNLLHSRLNLPFLHCGEKVQFSPGSLDQSPVLMFFPSLNS